MGKNYINKNNKKRIGRLGLISAYVEAIVNEMGGYDHPFSLKYLKMANTFLSKFIIEEVVQNEDVDNSDRKVIHRIVKNGELKFDEGGVVMSYSRKSKNHNTTKHNEIVKVSQDYIDDILNLLMTETCLGCTVEPDNVEECAVRKKLIMGDVPKLKENGKCQYEIKLHEAHKYEDKEE